MASRKKVIPIQAAEYCGNCRFYRHDGEQGMCHHFPPKVIVDGDSLFSIRPIVESSEWCGEHQGPRQ